MELTNEEIGLVFSKYLNPKKKMFLNPETGISYYGTFYQLSSMRDQFYSYKLILRTIEQLTDEELEILARTYTASIHPSNGRDIVIQEGRLIARQIDNFDGYKCARWNMMNMTVAIQYLISIGIAVPLFINVGHINNGKNALELGVAIQSPPDTPNEKARK